MKILGLTIYILGCLFFSLTAIPGRRKDVGFLYILKAGLYVFFWPAVIPVLFVLDGYFNKV